MSTDTQRIDWLQQHKKTVYRCEHQERRLMTTQERRYETVMVFDGWLADDTGSPKPTIREAIDAAMGLDAETQQKELEARIQDEREAIVFLRFCINESHKLREGLTNESRVVFDKDKEKAVAYLNGIESSRASRYLSETPYRSCVE